MTSTDETYQEDVKAVQRIGAVPTILDVVCRATGMGFAAVARVTEDRWIACQVLDNIDFGLPPGGELEVETTICNEIRCHRDVVAIDSVADNPKYAQHQTPRLYGLQSYISVPIILPDGQFFGTLCAIDPKPRAVNNPQTIGTFTLFAELIAYHLDAERRINAAEDRLSETALMSELREQFVAVLGHDLRNPLASISAGLNILGRDGWTSRTPVLLGMMRNSVLRMSGLIDNVLDLTRSRLGGGISLNLNADQPLRPTLEQVIDEIHSANPDRTIEASFEIEAPVAVDHQRIAQMLSNLLGNAISHGDAAKPIRVEGKVSPGGLMELVVVNGGEPIPPEMMQELFKAFHRGKVRNNAQGLGLGLYIASQIAEAHGGVITVQSNDDETRFAFRMQANG